MFKTQPARVQDARLVLHGRQIANLQNIVREAHTILSGAKNDPYLQAMAESILAIPVFQPALANQADLDSMRAELAERRQAELLALADSPSEPLYETQADADADAPVDPEIDDPWED